jgi:hypothetical protein
LTPSESDTIQWLKETLQSRIYQSFGHICYGKKKEQTFKLSAITA